MRAHVSVFIYICSSELGLLNLNTTDLNILMKQNNRMLALCGLVTAFCLGSCLSVSDELDLDKKISLDMQIGSGGLSVPLGSLEKIYLDSLIKTDGDDSKLKTLENGMYGITMDGTINKVDVGINDVTINIPKPDIKPLITEFNGFDTDTVKISAPTSTTTVGVKSIDMSEINSKLPVLTSNYSTPTVLVPVVADQEFNVPVNISKQSVACQFSYTLPSEVETLNKVWFGTQQGSYDGQKLTLQVDLSGVYELTATPEIALSNFELVFPDNFVLAQDSKLSDYFKSGNITVEGNKLSITDAEVQGLSKDNSTLPVTFYVKSADFSTYTGSIDYDKQLTYEFTFNIKGSADATATVNLHVGVSLSAALKMAEVDVATKSQSIKITQKDIESKCLVEDLEDVKTVKTIDLDEEGSVINLTISDMDIAPFVIGNTSSIVLTFSDLFVFRNECKTAAGETVGSWSAGNILTVNPAKAMGQTIKLHVKNLNVNKNVENNKIEIISKVSYEGTIVIDKTSSTKLSDLNKLGDKSVNFIVDGVLLVEGAEVETDVLTTPISDTTTVSINEKVDDAVVAISRVVLVEPAASSIRLKFTGVPESIEKMEIEDLKIVFPDFIKLSYTGTDQSRISASDNILTIDGDITKAELSSTGNGFVIEGLAIEEMAFATPEATVDGRLIIDSDVIISGDVKVRNQTVNSSELETVVVTPTVEFQTLKVKSVYGKVNPAIDNVHESVSIDLGDDISFLKDEANRLKLSDPKIIIDLNSSVTVPILLDLSLSSKAEDGKLIGKNIVPDDGPILLEACDPQASVRKTTLIISRYKRTGPELSDTVYVYMSRLPELMTTVPDSIMFDLVPSVDQSVDHYVDLSRELAVSGSYKVEVPLSFDSIYIEYSTDIENLGKDLEDIADKIEEAKLKLVANVESTIPLGVKLTVKAYDWKDRPMSDVEITPCQIGAGAEGGKTMPIQLDFNVKNYGLKSLDKLVVTAQCESDESTSGAALKKDQYLFIKDITLKAPDGVRIDLTDNKDK